MMPFSRDRRHQLRQVAHDLARLVRVRVDLVDRDRAGRSACRPTRPAPRRSARRAASAIVSGSPRLGTIDDLLAQRVVLHRAAGFRSEGEDRFLVRRTLFEPDRTFVMTVLNRPARRRPGRICAWISRASVVRLSCMVMTTPRSCRFGLGRALIFSIVSRRSSVLSSAKYDDLDRDKHMRRRHQRVDGENAEGRGHR